MTEKLYRMVNTNLVDDDGLVYYLIKKDEDDVCQVFGKHTAKAIVDELNNLHEEKECWKSDACNSKIFTKNALKQTLCSLIDVLDDGEYVYTGTFGWDTLKLDIKRVKG